MGSRLAVKPRSAPQGCQPPIPDVKRFLKHGRVDVERCQILFRIWRITRPISKSTLLQKYPSIVTQHQSFLALSQGGTICLFMFKTLLLMTALSPPSVHTYPMFCTLEVELSFKKQTLHIQRTEI